MLRALRLLLGLDVAFASCVADGKVTLRSFDSDRRHRKEILATRAILDVQVLEVQAWPTRASSLRRSWRL